jgi:hypothetical protein
MKNILLIVIFITLSSNINCNGFFSVNEWRAYYHNGIECVEARQNICSRCSGDEQYYIIKCGSKAPVLVEQYHFKNGGSKIYQTDCTIYYFNSSECSHEIRTENPTYVDRIKNLDVYRTDNCDQYPESSCRFMIKRNNNLVLIIICCSFVCIVMVMAVAKKYYDFRMKRRYQYEYIGP